MPGKKLKNNSERSTKKKKDKIRAMINIYINGDPFQSIPVWLSPGDRVSANLLVEKENNEKPEGGITIKPYTSSAILITNVKKMVQQMEDENNE